MNGKLTLLLGLISQMVSIGTFAADDTYMVIDLTKRGAKPTYLSAAPVEGWSDEYKTDKLVLRKVEPSVFVFGETDDLPAVSTPAVEATLTQPYWIGVFEVTQAQWKHVMGSNPSEFSKHACSPRRPVSNVSHRLLRGSPEAGEWPDSDRVGYGSFVGKLREFTGLKALDLPTEAQWECAARAGSRTAFADGVRHSMNEWDAVASRIGRYTGNAKSLSKARAADRTFSIEAAGPDYGTAPVGSYEPNAWGLYDLCGNVMEFCRDWYEAVNVRPGLPRVDPSGPRGATSDAYSHTLRGGAYFFDAFSMTLSERRGASRDEVGPAYGFRLVYDTAIAARQEAARAQAVVETSETFALTTTAFQVKLTLGARKKAHLILAYAETNTVENLWLDAKPQTDIVKWLPYRHRAHGAPPSCDVAYPDTLVRFSADSGANWFHFDYPLLPYFDSWNGLYDHETVVREMDSWQANYPAITNRVFTFTWSYSPEIDRMTAWLDGSYVGAARHPGCFRKLTIKADAAAQIEVAPLEQKADSPRFLSLAAQPNRLRTHPRLLSGATLSVGSGRMKIEGIEMDVWRPEQSFDQGRHRETCHHDDIMSLGTLARTAFANGPEYLEWAVPNDVWCAAWVLCAAVPEGAGGDTAEPLVGTEFGRYDSNASRAEVVSDFTRLPDAVTAASMTSATRRVVGTLTYRRANGTLADTPLWLVRHRLDAGELVSIRADVINRRNPKAKRPRHAGRNWSAVNDYLDFGFVGGGGWDGAPRSNVQIFGCTLERAPANFEIVEACRGNIFTADDRATTAIMLTAREAQVTGDLEWVVRDENFAEIRRGVFPVALEEKGSTARFDLDLASFGPGWYALDWTLRPVGDAMAAYWTHEAAFAQLGVDTREAGFESPYAGWPQLLEYNPALEKEKPETKGFGGGRHGCNPRREEVLALMHKAGFHASRHQLVKDENEFPAYAYTMSEWGAHLPGFTKPCDEARLAELIERDVAEFRELRTRYPHLNTVFIFHEDEPRGLSLEVLGERAPTREPYRGRDGRWETYYLTRYCQRFHEAFPGVCLRIANNSVSAERVARIARQGFDLNLIDELGSEVRGFKCIPEHPADLESPATLWGLRETGRLMGMTNPVVGASFEYVFRPERRVLRGDSDNMRQTNYAVRDWLIARGFGCARVTSGHLEDCASGYYDTDWGAAGLCRFYPTSYPKRMFVALATFTKVFDCATFTRRVPTGETMVYALEASRARKTPDYAYAFWTPEYESDVAITFPAEATVRAVTAFGAETTAPCTGTIRVGPTPQYFVSSAPLVSVAVVASVTRTPPPEFEKGGFVAYRMSLDKLHPVRSGAPAVPQAQLGTFTFRMVTNELHGAAIEATLVPEGSCPAVRSEYAYLEWNDPVTPFKRKNLYQDGTVYHYGLWVKGNGSFGRIGLVFRKFKGESQVGETQIRWLGNEGYLNFTGWQFMTVPLVGDDVRETLVGYRLCGVLVGSARQVLDPFEMRPVEGSVEFSDIYGFRAHEKPRDYDERWMHYRLRNELGGWL